MSWLQVRLFAKEKEVTKLEEALSACGALSITLEDNADQPILEPELGTMPIWEDTQIIGLFEASIDSDDLLVRMAETLKLASIQELPRHKIEILEDKDWVRAWMDDYHPMNFGSRLWVCPSWRKPPEPDAVNLMLDPGLAFGTGTHPTTALCLEYLDRAVEGGELVIDFGCGSGILGIAALLLGADKMVGVDIDPQALLATQDNAARNNIADTRYHVYLPDDSPQITGDIVVANILAGPLAQLAPQIADLAKPGGKLALSGLLAEQAEEISDCYSQWFDMAPAVQQGDWILLSGTKR